MAYTLPAWQDTPSTATALNAANLLLANAAINDLDTRVAAAEADLVMTAVKTTNYSAAASEFVRVDTTSGNVTVTLPTAPANGIQVGVKHVVRAGTNAVTVAVGGSDHFNIPTGPTTDTLTLLNDSAYYQYVSATAVWVAISDDSSLSQLDVRYKNVPVTLTDAATVATNAALGNYFRLSTALARSIGAPTNPTDGQAGTWEIKNTSGGALQESYVTTAGGFNLGPFTTLNSTTTAAGKTDIVTAVYNSVQSLWLVTNVQRGY